MDKTSYFMKGSSWHMGYHRSFTKFSFDEGRKHVKRGEVSSKAEYVWLNIAIFEVKSEEVCYIRREKSRQKMLSFENLRTNSSDDFTDKKCIMLLFGEPNFSCVECIVSASCEFHL